MAKQSAFVWDESYVAENDLSAKQYYGVEFSGEDQVDVCDAAADLCVGFLQNKPQAGEAARVRHLGISLAVSDGSGTAIAAGDRVGINSSGKVVKKTTADYSLCGVAMAASTANGTIIPVFLIPGLVFRTLGG